MGSLFEYVKTGFASCYANSVLKKIITTLPQTGMIGIVSGMVMYFDIGLDVNQFKTYRDLRCPSSSTQNTTNNGINMIIAATTTMMPQNVTLHLQDVVPDEYCISADYWVASLLTFIIPPLAAWLNPGALYVGGVAFIMLQSLKKYGLHSFSQQVASRLLPAYQKYLIDNPVGRCMRICAIDPLSAVVFIYVWIPARSLYLHSVKLVRFLKANWRMSNIECFSKDNKTISEVVHKNMFKDENY